VALSNTRFPLSFSGPKSIKINASVISKCLEHKTNRPNLASVRVQYSIIPWPRPSPDRVFLSGGFFRLCRARAGKAGRLRVKRTKCLIGELIRWPPPPCKCSQFWLQPRLLHSWPKPCACCFAVLPCITPDCEETGTLLLQFFPAWVPSI
jgi:hypothetical protein